LATKPQIFKINLKLPTY